MKMLVVSGDGSFTPVSASRSGKPVVLIQSVVHGGETAGKDATLILLRDLALGRFPAWLDHCIVLIIPVFNVDGHQRISAWNRGNQNGPRASGSRVTAQRLDLNRDYMKADAPEMRAWLRMYQSWLPHLLIDNHTSNGVDFQYDITFHIQTRQMLWKTVAAWNRNFQKVLVRRLEASGHVTGPYFEIEDPSQLQAGLRREFRTPGYSWGYAAVQNRSAIVAESHSLKSYRTQIWAHYDLMRHALDLVCAAPRALVDAVQSADDSIAALASAKQPRRLFLNGAFTGKTSPYRFRALSMQRVVSQVAGKAAVYGTRPVDITVSVLEQVKTTLAPAVPRGYLIPPEWSAVVELLHLHGIRTRRLNHSLEGGFEISKFQDERWDSRPCGGRVRGDFSCRTTRIKRRVPAGWIFVPMNQRAARVAFDLLEPAGPESLMRWGFFNTIFDQTEYLSDHVLIPIAAQMLRSNAALRAEFQSRLKTDARFRNSRASRLEFFYSRSSYAEKDKNVYPILRLPRAAWSGETAHGRPRP